MGTRINVLLPHQMIDWTDREQTVVLLNKTLPAVRAIEEFWNQEEPPKSESDGSWIATSPDPFSSSPNIYHYSGPGPLYILVNPFVIHIRTGGRWRGFLSIQGLRSLHIRAFESIARTFEASSMHIFPDNDFVNDVLWEGGNFEACSKILGQNFGNPLPFEERVDQELVAETDKGCPQFQYAYKRD